MKLISIVALLAPAALAAKQAPGDAWITLIKERCPDMREQCVDVAKESHAPQFDVAQASEALPIIQSCTPDYKKCIGVFEEDSPDVTFGGNLATCVLNISPDHFKYFLDNDSAYVPIPSAQNCALRELHRVTHVELGPLA